MREQLDRYMRASIEAFYNFIIVDAKGEIVYVNEHYAGVLGRKLEDIIGEDIQKVIPNTRLKEVLRTQKEEIGSIMSFYDHLLGDDVTVVCNRRPIWEDGKLIGVMAETTNRDLSEVEILYKKINEMQAENNKYREQIETLTTQRGPLDAIVGKSVPLMEVKKAILDYASYNLPVLFTGETGTGKEMFSNAIQQLGLRSQNSFVKINCAAIPKELMESELFGYEEGAFTGAKKGGKPGKLELANHGTLLLDEVGELPLPSQVKLLRVLQEGELERIGGTNAISVDFQLLCSTNRDLSQMVEEGMFRRDLYYRINTVELKIPPLRERIDDLPLLCMRFIHKINQTYGFEIFGISQEAINCLGTHSWPGNVRELEHTLERAAVLCKSGSIDQSHLVFFKPSTQPRPESAHIVKSAGGSLSKQRGQLERDAIIAALRKAGGNKAKAARSLNIDRSNLYAKIIKYHIHYEDE